MSMLTALVDLLEILLGAPFGHGDREDRRHGIEPRAGARGDVVGNGTDRQRREL